MSVRSVSPPVQSSSYDLDDNTSIDSGAEGRCFAEGPDVELTPHRASHERHSIPGMKKRYSVSVFQRACPVPALPPSLPCALGVCCRLYDCGPECNRSVLDVASWRLVMWSISNLLRVACFLWSVCLAPFY